MEKNNLKKHQANRLAGLGRVLYLTKGLSEELLRRYELSLKGCLINKGGREYCSRITKKEIISSREFFYANKLFQNKCKTENHVGYQFRIRVTKPIQYSEKGLYNKRNYLYLKFLKIPYKK